MFFKIGQKVKKYLGYLIVAKNLQCAQIGRFIAIWAAFQSLWLHFLAKIVGQIFKKGQNV